MATPAYIGILNNDRTVEAIYCHYDGYPDHICPLLSNYYNTEEAIRELIALGDLCCLEKRLKPGPGETHTASRPIDDVTIAYARDGTGEPWDQIKPDRFPSKTAFLRMAHASYHYLYDAHAQKWEWSYTR